jgi:hypothetical protein
MRQRFVAVPIQFAILGYFDYPSRVVPDTDLARYLVNLIVIHRISGLSAQFFFSKNKTAVNNKYQCSLLNI